MLYAVVAAIGGQHPAKSIAGEVDVRGLFGWQAAADGHLGGDGLVDIVCRDDLLAMEFAVMDPGLHPFRHIEHIAIDRTGRTKRVNT